MMKKKTKSMVSLVTAVVMYPLPGAAAERGCSQKLVDGTTAPLTTSYIDPGRTVRPFYQWENNFGYCGEVSMMQAGLDNGQWMSQFDARLICGTGLSQSGPDGACAAHHNQVNFNAQLLIEDPDTGVSGPNTYANAAMCLANSRLSATTYDYTNQHPGMEGYEAYMSWVKRQVMAGHQVTVALLINGGTDEQYDHEVAVMKIGTNHSPYDSNYYPDDVLYFDDHGAYTTFGRNFGLNPPIPPGAGADGNDCTPYVYGYSFASLANTRAGANRGAAQGYSIVIPEHRTIPVYTGGSGYDTVSILGPHNYAFSVAGPEDPAGETLPVALTIAGPTVTEGSTNPLDAIAGYDYENPMIGKDLLGRSCTNQRPGGMTHFELQAAVSGLTPGVSYNLYEYDFSSVSGEGAAAALAVPVADFNANAAMAARVTTFTAASSRYTQVVTTTSDKVVVLRCVPASAP
jgi:hypothetical protein